MILSFAPHPAILDTQMSLPFQPMPLLKRAAPFNDPEWIFELKYDGFRALAVIERGRAQLLSRNGASLRIVFCTGRINLRFSTEHESGH